MSDMKKSMELASKNWEKAKKRAETKSFGDIYDDGRYSAKVIDAVIAEAKSDSHLQIVYTYEFIDGDYAGKTKKAFKRIDREEDLARRVVELGILGYEIEDFSDLEPALVSLKKNRPAVQITLKTRGEFQDVYIDSLLSGEEVESSQEEEVMEEVDETEGTAIEIGTTVNFTWKGEEKEGVVKQINEDAGTLKIASEGKLYPVKADAISVPEAEVAEPEEEVVPEEPAAEEEVEEEPVKKVVKKTPSKPVAKKKKK